MAIVGVIAHWACEPSPREFTFLVSSLILMILLPDGAFMLTGWCIASYDELFRAYRNASSTFIMEPFLRLDLNLSRSELHFECIA
jgi:hypothetical protein